MLTISAKSILWWIINVEITGKSILYNQKVLSYSMCDL